MITIHTSPVFACEIPSFCYRSVQMFIITSLVKFPMRKSEHSLESSSSARTEYHDINTILSMLFLLLSFVPFNFERRRCFAFLSSFFIELSILIVRVFLVFFLCCAAFFVCVFARDFARYAILIIIMTVINVYIFRYSV